LTYETDLADIKVNQQHAKQSMFKRYWPDRQTDRQTHLTECSNGTTKAVGSYHSLKKTATLTS